MVCRLLVLPVGPDDEPLTAAYAAASTSQHGQHHPKPSPRLFEGMPNIPPKSGARSELPGQYRGSDIPVVATDP